MEEIFFNEIGSTQDYAKELLLSGKEDFVVLAKVQNKGRGRVSRLWQSPIGGLWFSFDMDFNNAGELFTMAIGVVVREVCYLNYGCDIKLKWPNDIILNDKKVGGIICERIGKKVIVGIGLNTNIESVDVDNTTTFFSVTGIRVDNRVIMRQIIKRCREMVCSGLEDIPKLFRENMAFKNKMCFVSSLSKMAKIIDVLDNGHLVVEVDGKKEEVFIGEINICI